VEGQLVAHWDSGDFVHGAGYNNRLYFAGESDEGGDERLRSLYGHGDGSGKSQASLFAPDPQGGGAMNSKMMLPAMCVFVLMLSSVGIAQAAPLPPLFRVNAPYFAGDVVFGETAVFWLGRVTPDENFADVRVGYNNQKLFVYMVIFDRRLWYDTSPTASDLTNWDAISLYFNKTGNAGSAPGPNAYRFDAQFNGWESERAGARAVVQGNGTGWSSVTLPFTATTSLAMENENVGGPNNNQDNRGWGITVEIPFSRLGLAGPPPQGTIWGLGVVVHDRDTSTGAVTQKMWPESLVSNQPATWGQLRFGLPTYSPPSAVSRGTTIISNKLNGAVVTDGVVGGNTLCGDTTDYWTVWSNKNYSGVMQFNIQNTGKVSDWPCASKYYVTFPLTAIPVGKVIISATLTLYQFGHAGAGDPNPGQPGNIQVLTVAQDWTESTLTWNTAPLARENISQTLVPLMPNGVPLDPGVPRFWDVSRAVAEAYASGEKLRLALYSSEYSLNTGKYFWSSDHDDWHPEARPTLTVVWGDQTVQPPAASVQKMVGLAAPESGAPITYTISVLGNGLALTLTDDVPAPLSFPGSVSVSGGGVVTRTLSARRITWTGTPSVGVPVTLTYVVSATVLRPTAIANTAVLTDAGGRRTTATASCIVKARQIWLPLILHP
jgi:hypothetical protein